MQCFILKNTDVNAVISCTTSISFQKKLDNVEEMQKETSFNATINEYANYINPLIQKDIASLYNDLNKCSLETLLKYDPGTWLEDRPPELVSLL